jgi:hypothetical protein
MTPVPQLARTLQTLFTTTADQLARQTGFVRRTSKLTGAVFAQTVVFTWLADPQATLEAMAQTAAGLGAPITPQGLDERFHSAAARFLEHLLASAMTQLVTADPVTIPLLQRFAGVYVQDSTVIRLPDAREEAWPGCGGSADSASKAAVKCFVRLDLQSGTLTRLVPLPARVSDSATVVADEDLPAGSLRLADLGFFDVEGFRRLGWRGVFWLSRLLPATKIDGADGRELPLRGWLAKQQGRVELPILLGATQRLPCRLLVERVPDAVARKRRERLLKAARRKGTKVSATKLALCAWTLYVTNAPAEKLTLLEALALGRARWQIELLFKLWKERAGDGGTAASDRLPAGGGHGNARPRPDHERAGLDVPPGSSQEQAPRAGPGHLPGPQAQQIIKPFLTTSLEAYLFSPQAYVEALHRRRAEQRKTKRTPSELKRCRKAKPRRVRAEGYNRRSYRVAISRACDKANAVALRNRAEDLTAVGRTAEEIQRELEGQRLVPRWSPLQLRHTAATAIRAKYGVEAAKVILGHTKVETTQIYAERDLGKAQEIMAEIG